MLVLEQEKLGELEHLILEQTYRLMGNMQNIVTIQSQYEVID
jgi:hypothetical protein